MKALEIAGSVASISSLVIALYFQWQGETRSQRNIAIATGISFLFITLIVYLQRRKASKSMVPSATNILTVMSDEESESETKPKPNEAIQFSNIATSDDLNKEKGTKFLERELPARINKLPKAKRSLKSIVMIDIDQLTLINKRYGSEVGDEVIRIVASIIKQREAITHCGRCGDDTFYAVLMKAEVEKTLKACEKLRRSIQHFPWERIAPNLRVTCSFGYAILDPHEPPSDWILRAIHGMLDAKKSGGNVAVSGPKFLGYQQKIKEWNARRILKITEKFYPERLKLRDHFS